MGADIISPGIFISGIIGGLILSIIIVKWYLRRSEQPQSSLENTIISLQYEVKSLHENVGGLQALLGAKEKELSQVQESCQHLEDLLDREKEQNRTILSQKKSSEIRTGHITETLAPLLMGDHDPKRLRWLGQPIDYIAFDDHGITFIEVKSGKSHLSHNQKMVKQHILDKKIYWQEFRIRGGDKKKS